MNGSMECSNTYVSREKVLRSSSVNLRCEELLRLAECCGREDFSLENSEPIVTLLIRTYGFYEDRKSRLAVQECLRAIARNAEPPSSLSVLVTIINVEASKGLAATSALILTDWCCVLLQEIRVQKKLWDEHGINIVLAVANTLSICLYNSSRLAVKRSARKKVQHALYLLYDTNSFGSECFNSSIDALTNGNIANSSNALVLGIISKIASIDKHLKNLLLSRKGAIIDFYVREIVGARSTLPDFITRSLDSFFQHFCTYQDLEMAIVPAVERALLRKPEVVLDGQIRPLFEAQSTEIDFSQLLVNKLMRPLLTHVRSSNQKLRQGASDLMQCILAHSYDTAVLESIANEILVMLQKAHPSTPEQKASLAQIILGFPANPTLSYSISTRLLQTVHKEVNEQVAAAVIKSFVAQFLNGIGAYFRPDEEIIAQLIQALTTKSTTVQRLWIINLGELLWELPSAVLEDPNMRDFALKLLKIFKDIATDGDNRSIVNSQPDQNLASNVLTSITLTKLAIIKNNEMAKQINNLRLEDLRHFDLEKCHLLNNRLNAKLTDESDIRWAVRALAALSKRVIDSNNSSITRVSWAQAFIFFMISANLSETFRSELRNELICLYNKQPKEISDLITDGLWAVVRAVIYDGKDLVTMHYRAGKDFLGQVIKSISPTRNKVEQAKMNIYGCVQRSKLADLMILCQPNLIPNISWINLYLESGQDPGTSATEESSNCLAKIMNVTEADQTFSSISVAACRACADLAFVAPQSFIKPLMMRLSLDLDVSQLDGIKYDEVAIYKTPEGELCRRIEAECKEEVSLDKKAKDYSTLKWEKEVRETIAQKKGIDKSAIDPKNPQVQAQLARESNIRKEISKIAKTVQRGLGISRSLIIGPPTDVKLWISSVLDLLLKLLENNAIMILEDLVESIYVESSKFLSDRLGALKPFIGVATIRAITGTFIASELQQEPLHHLTTRILYRLKLLSETWPFDTISYIYTLPLILMVLRKGGVGDAKSIEEADEQITLALEYLSSHAELCADIDVPRKEVLEVLIQSLKTYPQHYKLVKDTLMAICRNIAPSCSKSELSLILQNLIMPESIIRKVLLEAVDAEIDLSALKFCDEIWILCHDGIAETRQIAESIWYDNGMKFDKEMAIRLMKHLESQDQWLRSASAKAISNIVRMHRDKFGQILSDLQDLYRAKILETGLMDNEPKVIRRDKVKDHWEAREGIALAFKELAKIFQPAFLMSFSKFILENGALSDKDSKVRETMLAAAAEAVILRGDSKLEELMNMFEETLEASNRSEIASDSFDEAVVILYGALGRHLPPNDSRVPKLIYRLLNTLDTPSETVQYAVAQGLPPLVLLCKEESAAFITQLLNKLLNSSTYAAQRGAAYGLAGTINGRGIVSIREFGIMQRLAHAVENKRDQKQRQGAFVAYELLSLVLSRLFEPYAIEIVPLILIGFGDAKADIREACLDASRTIFSTLSSYGVKSILPKLLEGLEDDQWRSKKGACDSLGAMAYLDPQQLSQSLPDIIPALTNVLNDSHKEVRSSAKSNLQRFGDVISNPEIKGITNVLLKALSNPTKFTEEALDSLIKVSFIHYLDAPSLALLIPILDRGLGDRSGLKRKASQIIGSLSHLAERKDLISHLDVLIRGLRAAIVDPVPTTRATASKALGSLMEKLGEDAIPDVIPSLMAVLKSDTGAGDRLGSAQALSEILAGLGTSRLNDTLPSILQNATSSKAVVREGFMSLFIFLPACFGHSFSTYLSQIIPSILAGLADNVESVRETSLKAGRLLVKNYSNHAVDLLLPALEQGLADDKYRIRLSSVELVGDLLYTLTGISTTADDDEGSVMAGEAIHSLSEALGFEKRNRILSALYICRSDTAGLVRVAAVQIWKTLVTSPRVLKELIPTLSHLIVLRLSGVNMEQKHIASNALGELIRKAGEGVVASLLPSLESGLQETFDSDAHTGICIALREIAVSASKEILEEYESTLFSSVRLALVNKNRDVRLAAAEAFDALQNVFGKRVVDQVIKYLLQLLDTPGEAESALVALLTLLTSSNRSNSILPNLLPTLLSSSMSKFNARAIASVAKVAGPILTRKLSHIINGLMDNIVTCNDAELSFELNQSLDDVLISVDEFDGLNTAMNIMLTLVKDEDHRKRTLANVHMANFFVKAEIDISRYYQDLIRVFLLAYDDSDIEVVKSAWLALTELSKRLKKEEMEALVIPTRQLLLQVGYPGCDLSGFALPKGISSILPIFIQGLVNGNTDQRIHAALGVSDIIDRTSAKSLQPFVTQITGPLIRVVTERSTDVKAAVLYTLNKLLLKIPTYLKPFIPQLQRTFTKSLTDSSSEILRSRAARALGSLIELNPKIDPLVAELVNGSKTADIGVSMATLKALYEVLRRSRASVSVASMNSILGLLDVNDSNISDSMLAINAKLLSAILRIMPDQLHAGVLSNRVLVRPMTQASVLNLNSVLVECPERVSPNLDGDLIALLCDGVLDPRSFISESSVLAVGKYLLFDTHKDYDATKQIFSTLSKAVTPGNALDTRRLALVVIRTVSRRQDTLVRPHLNILAPAVFANVRESVIPIKMAAEAAFLTIFSVVSEDAALFNRYIEGPGSTLPQQLNRSMQDYFKRVTLRLAGQARDRQEAEGGKSSLGLSNDELEDEKEVWSVGRVELEDIMSIS